MPRGSAALAASAEEGSRLHIRLSEEGVCQSIAASSSLSDTVAKLVA
jgi:hypothetical protein